MGDSWAVLERELRGYLRSPLTYVAGAAFYGVGGYLFTASLAASGSASLIAYFDQVALLLIWLCPALTMGLLAEEARSGTAQLLYSSPVSNLGILWGKWGAALIIHLALLAGTLVYPAILFSLGAPDRGPIIGGYAGMLLLVLALTALGLCTSALASHPVAAGIFSLGLGLGLWLTSTLGSTLPGSVAALLDALSLSRPFYDFRSWDWPA